MVSDSGGFDDKSFNETAYNGLLQARDDLGIETAEIESNAESDFAPNVQAMIGANCNIVVTVGFLLATATEAAAKQNPEVDFAIVDNSSFEGVDNAKGLIFNTAESSFLAGYLAAAMSETGTVGTFGGAKIPTVTIFMDGFAQGVAHHNEVKGTDVNVIGWNAETQDGQFVPGDDPFQNQAGGRDTANTLIAQGADIILPVAGPAGLGGLQAAQASGGKVNAIWVDTDGCISAAEYCSSIITSVYKGMDVAVFEAIQASMAGELTSDPFVGTLENEGTGLSPFNEFEDKVSDELKAELDQLTADIISGDIVITSTAQPK
ncbi:BMP family ABC transporter substrate-binding protein [Tessaracoccus rhinocerotis]|uniref:BMP family ABC transporter substrate-binding protein n=2 Tax=Tessaracoccus rhinocerotis TaxID=1689449 RepID=A0A553K6I5_9ACTN|nr:BMP family ABC transporter substrate-binding protein [Tessaracoccus rhinocerotis]